MSIPFKKSPIEFNQRLLFPSNIFDLLPDDHECYLYKDIFKQLDTTSLESQYSQKGQRLSSPVDCGNGESGGLSVQNFTAAAFESENDQQSSRE
jgi:hypothetical protein